MGDGQSAGVIDLDVHTHVAGKLEVLLPYVDDRWRSRLVERRDVSLPNSSIPFREKFLPSSSPPASDAKSATALLDQAGVETGLLISQQAGALDGLTDRPEAAALARAFNDYHLEHFVREDSRLKLAAVVAPRHPELAAAEVRRVAEIPGVAAVWLPLIDRTLGSPHYDPILQAANDAELPVVVHPTANYGTSQETPHYPSGHPADDAERFVNLPQIAGGNITDMIWEGTFERFPRLRIVFVEFAWQWLAELCWKMDASWKAGRRNAPWLTKPPTEYVLDHVRVTWDPVGALSGAAELAELEMGHAERTLCFASGDPANPEMAPSKVAPSADAALRQRVLRENALETFGDRLR
jgi:predicted TIM-barrel fold metal-dependent hydrolase